MIPQINYIVQTKDTRITSKIIIGGATRQLAIEAFEKYNAGSKKGKYFKGHWKGKYGGQRDYKIVRMKLTHIKK